jgi:hypothetical protein
MGDSMSTIINATTTNGVVIQPDNSGSLVLQTNNGTTALTISTAQDTTLAGKLTTASSGIQFSDASTQTAAASPFGLKNRIINGAMVIDQRNAGASVTIGATSITYTLDRFWAFADQASKFSIQRNAGSVTPPTGFTNYLGVTSLSAYSIVSGDRFVVVQSIEGFNTADLDWGTANAKTVTLSFWVRSSLTGTFGGALRNSANNRSYPYSYTISSANTWEQKTVTIAGDTSGTWLTNNDTGIQVSWSLGSGSTYSGTAGAWVGSNILSVTGATSVVGTNGATFYITGVQLEQNTSATPFERRLYNQELANCQRYLYHWDSSSNVYARVQTGVIFAANSVQVQINLPVVMRSAPTLESYSTASTFRIVSNGSGFNASSVTTTESNNIVLGLNFGFTGGTGGNCAWVSANNSSSAYLNLSAEL